MKIISNNDSEWTIAETEELSLKLITIMNNIEHLSEKDRKLFSITIKKMTQFSNKRLRKEFLTEMKIIDIIIEKILFKKLDEIKRMKNK